MSQFLLGPKLCKNTALYLDFFRWFASTCFSNTGWYAIVCYSRSCNALRFEIPMLAVFLLSQNWWSAFVLRHFCNLFDQGAVFWDVGHCASKGSFHMNVFEQRDWTNFHCRWFPTCTWDQMWLWGTFLCPYPKKGCGILIQALSWNTTFMFEVIALPFIVRSL